jgi:membrane-bound lytic murein transglycosylase MltF
MLEAAFAALSFGLWAAAAVPATAASPPIPEASFQYRFRVEQEAARYWGLAASPARLAAQIQQESGWNAHAESRFAQGLAQFTPATSKWLPSVCPEVGRPDPWNPSWSIAAAACYDAWLYRLQRPMRGALAECSRWAFVLRAYNGGTSWLILERRMAITNGANPDDWREVERFRARSQWAHRENRAYPRRILLALEPMYLRAGWPGEAACP